MDVGGSWTGPELEVELEVDGTEVRGTFTLGGVRLPARGELRADGVAGTFESEGARFPFAARREGAALVIESDGAVLRLARKAGPAPRNPLAGLRGAAPTPAEAPASDDGGGTTYRHPSGAALRLPRGWQVTAGPLGLQLAPPDPAHGPAGPAELYLLASQPAPGIGAVDDPRIASFLDAQLRALVPTLSAPAPPAPCEPGRQLRWSGLHPMTGTALSAVALYRLDGGAVSGIVALAETPQLARRLATLEAIFRSFHRGEARHDPALVGVWHHGSYQGSSSLLSGSATSSELRRTVELGPDGTLLERSTHEGSVSVQGRDGGGDLAWRGGYAAQTEGGRAGRWSAADGLLSVEWSDGTSAAWQYQLQGPPGARRLLLLAPGARQPMEWTERPVA